ncbi:MAG: sensor domain-containing diguanylate cyclase [Pseudomonadota bacterium]
MTYNETARLIELRESGILDTPREQAFDDIASLAAAIFRAPIAAVSFIDDRRQWFKSIVGMDLPEVPLGISLCLHTLRLPGTVLEVPDTLKDPRFVGHPIVDGAPRVRLYVSAPILSSSGLALGTVCAMDMAPRAVTRQEIQAIESLGRQVTAHLELRSALRGMEREGMTDYLTGLWNRRAFDRRLGGEWNLHRISGKPLSLLAIDLDHFKRINDTFGHPVGDEVLARTAKVIRSSVRENDLAARFGGEEFTVILPGTTAQQATVVAEKIRAAIETARWTHAPVTASIGLATLTPVQGGSAPSLMQHADRALYEAKHAGRNRVVGA